MIETKVADLTLNIPEDVTEITLGQFLELREAEKGRFSSQTVLSILTKTDEETIDRLDRSLKTYNQMEGAFNLCNAVYGSMASFDKSVDKFRTPKTITILGETYKIPQDLKKSPFGAIMLVKSLMRQQGPAFDPTERIDELLAHFLYETITGAKYNEYRADDLKPTIREIPFMEAIQLFNFFFLRSSRLLLPTSSHFLTLLHLKKRKLVSKLSEYMKTLTR